MRWNKLSALATGWAGESSAKFHDAGVVRPSIAPGSSSLASVLKFPHHPSCPSATGGISTTIVKWSTTAMWTTMPWGKKSLNTAPWLKRFPQFCPPKMAWSTGGSGAPFVSVARSIPSPDAKVAGMVSPGRISLPFHVVLVTGPPPGKAGASMNSSMTSLFCPMNGPPIATPEVIPLTLRKRPWMCTVFDLTSQTSRWPMKWSSWSSKVVTCGSPNRRQKCGGASGGVVVISSVVLVLVVLVLVVLVLVVGVVLVVLVLVVVVVVVALVPAVVVVLVVLVLVVVVA